MKARIAVLVSGGGTNLQALIDKINEGIITSGEIVVVVASKEAYATTRAQQNNIPCFVVPRKGAKQADFERSIKEVIAKFDVDMIVLAGFLCILSEDFIKSYPQKSIVNVHPSLIPSFCGKGCYGIKVHEMALARGVKVTGATVHYVNEIADDGEILAQKAVMVMDNDTPETLQLRVMEQAEWQILPAMVEKVANRIIKEKQ